MKEYIMQLEEAMVSDDGEVCIKSKAVKELIRCKDCKYFIDHRCYCAWSSLCDWRKENDFCSQAERKK